MRGSFLLNNPQKKVFEKRKIFNHCWRKWNFYHAPKNIFEASYDIFVIGSKKITSSTTRTLPTDIIILDVFVKVLGVKQFFLNGLKNLTRHVVRFWFISILRARIYWIVKINYIFLRWRLKQILRDVNITYLSLLCLICRDQKRIIWIVHNFFHIIHMM